VAFISFILACAVVGEGAMNVAWIFKNEFVLHVLCFNTVASGAMNCQRSLLCRTDQ
jgi:hypothetical protein